MTIVTVPARWNLLRGSSGKVQSANSRDSPPKAIRPHCTILLAWQAKAGPPPDQHSLPGQGLVSPNGRLPLWAKNISRGSASFPAGEQCLRDLLPRQCLLPRQRAVGRHVQAVGVETVICRLLLCNVAFTALHVNKCAELKYNLPRSSRGGRGSNIKGGGRGDFGEARRQQCRRWLARGCLIVSPLVINLLEVYRMVG
eukprot:366464-Chlamydomonas_euryale.AAC.2